MEVTNKDIKKHYLSSVLVYGIVLLLLFICPVFSQDVTNILFSYFSILVVYYLLYVLLAYPLLLKIRPESVLNSGNVIIVNYFKRFFKKGVSLSEQLNNINCTEEEKQSFIILFIKAFFGTYCLSVLCSKYFPQLGYDFDFLGAMLTQASDYIEVSGVFGGIAQFIDDTADMWLTLIFTVTTFVFAVSYLTETKFLKNKIKYADTSFLGITSCLICYYPFILLTEKFIPVGLKELIPIENTGLRITIYVLVILANIVSLFAILRLGTKSGNLTNRGIVTGFPYNIVRHPDYGAQICYVILTMIPMYFVGDLTIFGDILLTIGMFVWVGIYVLRALTEERNLMKDDDYKKYCEKTKYRFIPKVI